MNPSPLLMYCSLIALNSGWKKIEVLLTKMFKSLEQSIYDLSIVTLTSKVSRVHPLTMVDRFAKFDEDAHSGLVSTSFKRLFPYNIMSFVSFDLENH